MKILALEFSSAHRSVAVVGQASCRSGVGNDFAKTGWQSHPGAPVDRQDACPTTGMPGRNALPNLPAAASHSVCEVIETSAGRTMQPFRMIEAALAQAGLERRAIECIVVGLGPGSYNGIRAGIALAQGWQLAREVKLLGISSAEAMAAQARADGLRGLVNVVVDAQRGEWYLGAWELTDAGRREIEPLRIVAADVVRQRAEAGQLILGPEAARCVPTGRLVFARAATLAQLALGCSDFVGGELLEPIYLRETTFVKAPPPRII